VIVSALNAQASAGIERFKPNEGDAIEVWRITKDPSVRDHANYHNMQCWSPDGRYLCFTHHASDGRQFGSTSAAEVHLYDLHEQKDLRIDKGTNPRWANRHNWLFYLRYRPADGPRYGRGTQVMWKNLQTGELTRIGHGIERLKYTDCNDRWLYGYGIRGPEDEGRKPLRVAIAPDSAVETLPGDWQVGYNSLMVNPAYPMIVSRDHDYRDYYYATEGTRDIPFVARHFLDHNLDGNSRSTPFPSMEGSHFSWSGDGSYFLLGNGQMRGKKWDQPLPSNIHFLAAISSGDVSPCGRSGRWICGDAGVAEIRVADLRSGDGWTVMETNSYLCFPTNRDYSGPYDIDLKGSPDGTKIAFVSTYDLKDGPVARISEEATGDSIRVDSTKRFPPRGRLINASGFGGEVLSYQRKTDKTFEGLTRGLYGTSRTARLRRGQPLTSFEAMLIPRELREDLPLKSSGIRNIIRDKDSPLLLQRSSDLYTVVIRLPDCPHLRRAEGGIQLIPGENHWETYGYHVFNNGERITATPIRPGGSLELPVSGAYTAVAVEWSGLQSKPSLPFQTHRREVIAVLSDKPDDFSWTREKRVGQDNETVTEMVHLHDGVIQRSWYRNGQVVKRHDLNAKGQATRRLFYRDGKLARREYHNRDGRHVSTERFGTDGYITESIQHGSRPRCWWYERGAPVKYTRGQETYLKDGDRWIKTR
jgi:hypothetical protein